MLVGQAAHSGPVGGQLLASRDGQFFASAEGLANQGQQDWRDRSHFFGVAAHLVCIILVDHARSKLRDKRGGQAAHLSLDEALDVAPQKSSLLLDLDEALGGLASFDPRKAQVIEMRFFAGMSSEETAEAPHVGVTTVGRNQRRAEAWLNVDLKSSPTPIRIDQVIESAQN